jgi:hypothetical protein
MPRKHDIVQFVLASTFGPGATIQVPYPTGRTAEDYLGGVDHQIFTGAYRALFSTTVNQRSDFTVAPGPSTIGITLVRGDTMVTGTRLFIYLDRAEMPDGLSELVDYANPNLMQLMLPVKITLGAPATASANAAVLSQACTLATGLATGFNGALSAAGRATFPSPRNVVAAWTNTAVLTVTGTDDYGNVVRESSGSGTSFTGKKAFKTVTAVTTSADITGLTVGTGVVLGLPVYLADVADVIREIQDSVAATAGTIAAGDLTTPTALTGDVRGTYNPNSAPNGARVYELVALLRAPSYRGIAQFAG